MSMPPVDSRLPLSEEVTENTADLEEQATENMIHSSPFRIVSKQIVVYL